MGDTVGGSGKVTLMLVADAALTVEPLGAVNRIENCLSTNACYLISSPVVMTYELVKKMFFKTYLSAYCVIWLADCKR